MGLFVQKYVYINECIFDIYCVKYIGLTHTQFSKLVWCKGHDKASVYCNNAPFCKSNTYNTRDHVECTNHAESERFYLQMDTRNSVVRWYNTHKNKTPPHCIQYESTAC